MTANNNTSIINMPKRKVKKKIDKFNKFSRNIEETDFEYVVKPAETSRVAFGMGGDRYTLPQESRGMNSFMRCLSVEQNPKLGPSSYSPGMPGVVLYTKPTSQKGFGGQCRFDPRFRVPASMKTPAPNAYDIPPSITGKPEGKVPFDSGTPIGKREPKRITAGNDPTPAPGSYDIDSEQDRRILFSESFGGRRWIQIPVPTRCAPYSVDTCCLCGAMPPPGDYYKHSECRDVFLCKVCLEDEIREHYLFTRNELKKFTRLRNCTFMHQHDGATAALRLMTDRQIKKKLRLEAYLSRFTKPFPVL